ncbi:MAG: hypothetical protein ACI38Y_03585 [Candidatus Methanomethylophilaceae archaeon]
MSDRYCPHCGELVPSTSVTCPKCYRKIPAEPEVPKEERRRERQRDTPVGERPKREYNKMVALILAVIPGFFGILGLGQIYRNYRNTSGYFILLIGLLLFAGALLLLTSHVHGMFMNILTTVGAFPLMLLYAFVFIGSVIDILLNSVFRMEIGSFGH